MRRLFPSQPLYAACLTKMRKRATRDEMAERFAVLRTIVAELRPCTVRQVFYQATIRGVVEKTEAGYDRVQRALVAMRRNGSLPYGWIADNTRWQMKPRTWSSLPHMLEETARLYRRRLWDDAGAYCEVWLEKDALAGVVAPVTERYDVPLMVARGFSSLSFLYEAAQDIARLSVPAYVFHLGDHDPSGQCAAGKIEETLRELAPGAEIHFERLAVRPWQIDAWKLPSRPTKPTDTRAKAFGYAESVELDAIHPETLRGLVLGQIEALLPARQIEVLEAAEASEREILRMFARQVAA